MNALSVVLSVNFNGITSICTVVDKLGRLCSHLRFSYLRLHPAKDAGVDALVLRRRLLAPSARRRSCRRSLFEIHLLLARSVDNSNLWEISHERIIVRALTVTH